MEKWIRALAVKEKKELSQQAKLSIYRSSYVPTLIYGGAKWITTEKMTTWIRGAEMNFLYMETGISIGDKARRFINRGEPEVELQDDDRGAYWISPPGGFLDTSHWKETAEQTQN